MWCGYGGVSGESGGWRALLPCGSHLWGGPDWNALNQVAAGRVMLVPLWRSWYL
jgi:hypothetical protein